MEFHALVVVSIYIYILKAPLAQSVSALTRIFLDSRINGLV